MIYPGNPIPQSPHKNTVLSILHCILKVGQCNKHPTWSIFPGLSVGYMNKVLQISHYTLTSHSLMTQIDRLSYIGYD